jgi:dTDP-6-deoxy-L-talose 4-dehydrogenase (NAD+)
MQSGELSEGSLTLPNNPYGYAKNALRHQLEFLQAETFFNLTWTRLFYMYGENQPSSSLYPQFKEAVKLKQQTFNMSGGEQLRDYLPVESVANYIVCLALAQQNLGVVNICSGEPISVRNLVEKWRKAQDWQIELNFGFYPYPSYEPLAFWGTKIKLDKALEKTANL